MKKILAIAALGACLGPSLAQQAAPAHFPVTALTAGMHVIRAEVASREEQRRQGLMFRKTMAQNEGMVFVFDSPAQVCMWMKNTFLPLSVAFIDGDGRIVNIEHMQPQTTGQHCAQRPVSYALEMNQGWFEKKGIKPGMKIGGLPR
ncbi:MAG TPA: DUF192 domain-containing protein [Noviherbaspirillum sp.]